MCRVQSLVRQQWKNLRGGVPSALLSSLPAALQLEVNIDLGGRHCGVCFCGASDAIVLQGWRCTTRPGLVLAAMVAACERVVDVSLTQLCSDAAAPTSHAPHKGLRLRPEAVHGRAEGHRTVCRGGW